MKRELCLGIEGECRESVSAVVPALLYFACLCD